MFQLLLQKTCVDLKAHCIPQTFMRKDAGKNWYLSVRNWVKAPNAVESSISFPSCQAETEYSIIHSLLCPNSSTGAAQSDLSEATCNVSDALRRNTRKRLAVLTVTGFGWVTTPDNTSPALRKPHIKSPTAPEKAEGQEEMYVSRGTTTG